MPEVFRVVPRSALAVYAHPDDADVACGGTLAAWAQQGSEVRLLVLADGAKGTSDATADVDEVARQRAEELVSAAEVLGLAGVERLGRPDGEVTNDLELRGEIVGAIRRHRPAVVLAPDPTATFFGGVYVNHRDHREAGWAVLDAVAPAAAMPHYFPGTGPAHHVGAMLLSGTLEADAVVDISGSLDLKVAAVLRHRSQFQGDDEWARSSIIARAVQAGRLVGLAHGEAFRHVAFES